MASITQSIQLQAWIQRLNPLVVIGINGSELSQAYRYFRKDPATGIRHIIAAGRGSRWENWVEARLAGQAIALAGMEITINLTELSQLPEDTLGGAYARHMVSQGFDPQTFMTPNDPRETWVNRRAAIAHDIHHIITGFDASPVGEFGVAAFSLLQYWDLLNVFVLSFLPLFALSELRFAPKLIASTLKGLWLGWICRPIFAYPFEANWHKPLTQVREELGICTLISN